MERQRNYMNNELEELEAWVARELEKVTYYLEKESIESPNVGEWPAFEVAPYFAIWAVESKSAPGHVGWWAFSGDIPTDYVTKSGETHPRNGLKDLLITWRSYIPKFKNNETYPGVKLGSGANLPKLGELLERRVSILEEWLYDDSLWEHL